MTSPRLETNQTRSPAASAVEQIPCFGQSCARPVASFSLECCQRNLPVSTSKQSKQPRSVSAGKRFKYLALLVPTKHPPVGHDGVSVGLRSQLCGPLDVPAGLHVPIDWDVFSFRRIVPRGPPAPLRPIMLSHILLCDGCQRLGGRVVLRFGSCLFFSSLGDGQRRVAI